MAAVLTTRYHYSRAAPRFSFAARVCATAPLQLSRARADDRWVRGCVLTASRSMARTAPVEVWHTIRLSTSASSLSFSCAHSKCVSVARCAKLA